MTKRKYKNRRTKGQERKKARMTKNPESGKKNQSRY